MSATDQTCNAAPRAAHTITSSQTLLFAFTVGVIVTNLFAPQTLVGVIAPTLGVDPAASGLIAMATLLGYAAGLFLLVPLADLAENRRLVLVMIASAATAAAAAAIAPNSVSLLALLFALGAASSAIQILVPIAASMAAPERRGRVIGDVMSGLMLGILLSRPLASLIAGAWGWRAFYGASAVAVAMLAAVLVRIVPQHRPATRSGYPALIASLWHFLHTEPELRQRALTASLVMAAFSVFWTAVALRLSQPPFELSQRGIALFALVGAGGAVVTPLAGRAGDRGWTRGVTLASHLILIGALALAAWAGTWTGTGTKLLPLVLMGVAAVLLDVGVTADQTLGRHVVNLLRPEARGRLNGLFVGLFFIGGAVGSAATGPAWTFGGWLAICAVGAAFGAAALVTHWIWRSR
jgi:predicted MFS family arabinose efflux permease